MSNHSWLYQCSQFCLPARFQKYGVSFSSPDPSLFLSLCPVSSPKGKSYTFVKRSLPSQSCKYSVTVLRLHGTLHFLVCFCFCGGGFSLFVLFLGASVCLILRLEPGSLQQSWPLPLKCTPSPKDSFWGLGFLAFAYRNESHSSITHRISGPSRPLADCTVFSSFPTN